MSAEPPSHQRPFVQWIVIASTILAAFFGAPAFLSWFGVGPHDLLAFWQRAGTVSWTHKYYFGTGILVGLIYLCRRPLGHFFCRFFSFIRGKCASLLETLMEPVVPRPNRAIHYGELFVFQHFTTGKYLTSLDGQYYTHAAGSGQQIVFGASVPDENSIWRIDEPHGTELQTRSGTFVRDGEILRIYHLASDQYLHSHVDESPASTPGNIQREVSVSSQNNPQDNWKIRSDQEIVCGARMRFEHSDGNQFLHSHDRTFSVTGRCFTLEVTCCAVRNEDDFWILRPIKFVGLVPPSQKSTSKLRIYWACFGAGKTYRNVTEILRTSVRNERLSIVAYADRVGSSVVGDPCPQMPKSISVHFSFNGVRAHKTAAENQTLELP